MKHSANLQILRGLAATLVFCLHFMLVERKLEHGVGLMGDWAWYGSISVDLFFALSGFIMVSITRGSFGRPNAWPRFIVERAMRVYPAYWLFSSTVLVVYLLNPAMVNSAQGSQVNVGASLLLLPQHLLPLLSVGWTLVHEVYFYVVFSLLLAWLPERFLAPALLAWAVVIGMADRALEGHGSAWLKLVLHPLTMDFIAGALAALVAVRPSPRVGALALGVAVAWCVAGFMLAPMGAEQVFMRPWPRVAICAVPCGLAMLAAVHFDMAPARLWQRVLAWVGDRSYSFYLVHLLVLSVVSKVWARFPTTGVWDNAVAMLVGYGISLAIASTTFRFVEKPVMRLARRWVDRAWPRSRPSTSVVGVVGAPAVLE